MCRRSQRLSVKTKVGEMSKIVTPLSNLPIFHFNLTLMLFISQRLVGGWFMGNESHDNINVILISIAQCQK